MSRKCGSCGKENPDYSVYCGSCGSELASLFPRPVEADSALTCDACGASMGASGACPRCGSHRTTLTPPKLLGGASVSSPLTVIGAIILAIGAVALLYGLVATAIVTFVGSLSEDVPGGLLVLGGSISISLALAGALALVGGIQCIKRTGGGWPLLGAICAVISGFFLGTPVAVAAIVCLILMLMSKETD